MHQQQHGILKKLKAGNGGKPGYLDYGIHKSLP
jgi:hypothetical protein